MERKRRNTSRHRTSLPPTLPSIQENPSFCPSYDSSSFVCSCSCFIDKYGTLQCNRSSGSPSVASSSSSVPIDTPSLSSPSRIPTPSESSTSSSSSTTSVSPSLPVYPALRKLCYFKTSSKRKLCSPQPHIVFHMDTSSPHFPQDIHPIKGICITVMQSNYFWASVGYVLYSVLILILDLCSTDDSNSPYTYSCGVSISTLGHIQSFAAVFYIVNAIHYIFTWRTDYGYPYLNIIALPEYFNTLSGFLYAASTFRYSAADEECGTDYYCALYRYILIVELIASIMQVIAAIGWFWSWWQTYPRGILGRGWTFDDPDFNASWLTLIASFIYLAYSTDVYRDPSTYDTDTLYIVADIMYFVGAIFYLLAVLRDKGSLWCFPVGGTWDYDTFLFISRPSSSSFYIQHQQYKQALLQDYNRKHFVETSSYPYRREISSPSSVVTNAMVRQSNGSSVPNKSSSSSSWSHPRSHHRITTSQSTRAILSTRARTEPINNTTIDAATNNNRNYHNNAIHNHHHHHPYNLKNSSTDIHTTDNILHRVIIPASSSSPPLLHANTVGVSSSYDGSIQQYIDSTTKKTNDGGGEEHHHDPSIYHGTGRRRSLVGAFDHPPSFPSGVTSTSSSVTVSSTSSSASVPSSMSTDNVTLPLPEALITRSDSSIGTGQETDGIINGVPKE